MNSRFLLLLAFPRKVVGRMASASPPDVRQGLALPAACLISNGLRPSFGLHVFARAKYWLILSLLPACVCAGCAGNAKQAIVEQAPVAYQATPQSTSSTPLAATLAAAPKLPEVEEAVKRVFKGAAVIHPDYKSSFLTGDFNGDSSQDLAVVVKPAPDKLDEMNQQYPSWLLRDPRVPHDPRTPLRVAKDETLLAVIHGYGSNDWRDPQATQTFLLKNVVGSGMRVQNGKEFVTNNSGRKLPRPEGDLIGETLKGAEGFLYYSTASYSWYDPKTFTGEPQTAGAFHRGAMRRTHNE